MLKDLTKDYVAPLLKRHGFKKKGLTWNKQSVDLIQVVNFQLSRFDDAKSESFTINIGVFDPGVWEKCWEKVSPKFIKEEDCFPRLRIGQLLSEVPNEAIDLWWTFNSATNSETLAKEIESILERKILPFLDDMSDGRKINEFYSPGSYQLLPIEKVYLAIIKDSIGDTGSSDDLLDEVGAMSDGWSNRVMVVRGYGDSVS